MNPVFPGDPLVLEDIDDQDLRFPGKFLNHILKMGRSCRQGMHLLAPKSTRTGCPLTRAFLSSSPVFVGGSETP